MIQQAMNTSEGPLTFPAIRTRIQMPTRLVQPLIRNAVVAREHSERIEH